MAEEREARTERWKSIDERVKEVLPEGSRCDHFVNMIAQLEFDNEALIVLKGRASSPCASGSSMPSSRRSSGSKITSH